MKSEFGFRYKGYSYGTDILYVYCDECGSFGIKTYLSVRKWIIIIVSCLLTFVFVKNALADIRWLSYLLLGYVAGWFLLKQVWGDKDYKCRKCGNSSILINDPKDYASEIPKYNTLDFPSSMEVIDVPDHLTQKRYQGYWDDDYR
jgi:hypothetical protein